MVQQLEFVTTNQGPFPYTTNQNEAGICVARVSGDPMVVFMGQTSYDDDIVYLSLALDHEYKRHPNPPGWEVISGMAFDPNRDLIWTSNTTSDMQKVMAFDPVTEAEVGFHDFTYNQPLGAYPRAIGTNGLLFIRSNGPTVELRTMNGVKLGERGYPGRNITGASASPWSWTLADKNANEIVIIDPFGNEVAVAEAPGTAGGLDAIAFDYVVNHDRMPQVIPPSDGSAPGDPDRPWDPEPYKLRHRIYVANDIDQVIYAGYLTEA